jgi:hypothetical protein
LNILPFKQSTAPTSLAIKEMQIKTTLRFHLTPITMLSSRTQKQMLASMWGKRNPHTLLVEMKNNMEAPQKVKIELPYDPGIPLLGIYLKDISQVIIKATAHPCGFFVFGATGLNSGTHACAQALYHLSHSTNSLIYFYCSIIHNS